MTPRRGRHWWLAFGLCTLAVLGAMAAMSVVMLALEKESAAVRIRESALRVALWRMDSFLAPHLAREAARPHYEYLPFFEANTTYTRMYSEIAPGSVLAPSPLLTFSSEYFPIHFQVGADGAVTSPQVPEGNELDLAEATLLAPGEIDRRRALLERVRALIDVPALELACSMAEMRMTSAMTDPVGAPPRQTLAAQQQGQSEEDLSIQESQKRAAYNWNVQMDVGKGKVDTGLAAATNGASTGALVPVWLGAPAGAVSQPELLFVRRLKMDEGDIYQGFMVDWNTLRAALLEQVNDLFTEARLAPIVGVAGPRDRAEAHMLATIPAVLEGAAVAEAPLGLFTPARIALLITWLAVLGAIAAAGLTLRASIDYGERRSRFASAVTHELRTPLTTFELYAGMLAEGMVPDPAQAREYHATLRDEAERLSAIVENVLAYAQVEEGRLARTPQRATLREAVAHVLPALERRAAKCGSAIESTVDDAEDRAWLLDVETIGQILFNLVDNACKYGCPGSESGQPAGRIELKILVRQGAAEFHVIDSGPGVPDSIAKRIFEAFDRGAVAPGAPAPGVGIGLTLSRELARAMGGELFLDGRNRGQVPGACFTLRIPLRVG